MLYRDGHSGEYVIPGAFLRNQVLLAAGLLLESVYLLPGEGSESDRGRIVIRTSLGEQRASLSGAPWRLARMLYEQKGEFVAADELQQLLGLDSIPPSKTPFSVFERSLNPTIPPTLSTMNTKEGTALSFVHSSDGTLLNGL